MNADIDLQPLWLGIAWVIYLGSAWILYRVGLRRHLDDWFPNSQRMVRLAVLVMLFSPALMHSGESVYAAPSLLVLMFQLMTKSALGCFRAILPWFLFGGIALLIDAAKLRRRELRGAPASRVEPHLS